MYISSYISYSWSDVGQWHHNYSLILNPLLLYAMSHIGHMFPATQQLKQLKIHLIADRWRSNLDHHSTFQISLPGNLTEWDFLRIQICSKRKVFLDSPTCFTNNLLKIASQFGLLKLAQRIPLFWGHQTYYVSIVSWLQISQFTGSVHGEIRFCTKISHNQSHQSIYLHFARSTKLWCRIEDFHCSPISLFQAKTNSFCPPSTN